MLTPRVLLLIYNPVLETAGGVRLHQHLGWNDPDALCAGYIEDVYRASHGYVRYQIVERIELDDYPRKQDGFRYTDETYLRAWRTQSGFHQPDTADYAELLQRSDFVRKLEAGVVDELWVMAFPYGGLYESCMGGRGAIWCNGPVIPGTEGVSRRFVVMGFSFERGVGEMLENLGHRAESILEHVFSDLPSPEQASRRLLDRLRTALARLLGRRSTSSTAPDLAGNLWWAFIRHEKTHPGQAACGNVHFAPNSRQDYDWGNPAPVLSSADDWLSYPNLMGEQRWMTCADWGNGDIRLHHLWWFERFPHVEGFTPTGKRNNWWDYVVGLAF
ncbi:MAG: hypothetical protein RMM31_10990 [Anaerolineae bacterium]|nr:hypothetical protein [Anaerolineae bacterium]